MPVLLKRNGAGTYARKTKSAGGTNGKTTALKNNGAAVRWLCVRFFAYIRQDD
jgi:hypothetical protein